MLKGGDQPGSEVAAVAQTPATPIRAANAARAVITRPLPSIGKRLSVVGLGGANTFSETAGDENFAAVDEGLHALVENSGTVFDTAAGYGASEEVSGRVAQELGIANRMLPHCYRPVRHLNRPPSAARS